MIRRAPVNGIGKEVPGPDSSARGLMLQYARLQEIECLVSGNDIRPQAQWNVLFDGYQRDSVRTKGGIFSNPPVVAS